MNKLQPPEYYHQQLNDLRREKKYAKRWKVKPLPACMAFANLLTKEPGTIEDYLIRGEKLPRHCDYYKPVAQG